MQSMSPAVLGAVIFAVVMVAAYILDLIFGPLAVILVSAVIVIAGYVKNREWLTYLGGLLVCAGLTYAVLLDTVQTGSFFAGFFGLLMLGAVVVCAMLAADRLIEGV